MKPSLPADVVPYRRTPEFTAETTPAGLRRDHSTRAGTWGRIVVLAGTLRYEIAGRDDAQLLDCETPGIIEPEVLHKVAPSVDARFYVEFLR